MAPKVYHAICVHHEARCTAFEVRIEAEVGTRVHDPGVVVLRDEVGVYWAALVPDGACGLSLPFSATKLPF